MKSYWTLFLVADIVDEPDQQVRGRNKKMPRFVDLSIPVRAKLEDGMGTRSRQASDMGELR
ncbi:hypothetical protein [Sphingomonas sp. SRS2]|uniref:hypothetical protein n=1 Tax=Sphingomonas sp. SRS2 TaxID=133190 RepID=UPI000B264C07|nr:hypothetical protein [Sphingomonas sp. SRS2]